MIAIRCEINMIHVEQPSRLLNVRAEFEKALPSRGAMRYGC